MNEKESEDNAEFVRKIEVESNNVDINLTQHVVGNEACVVWDAGIVLGKYLDHQKETGNSVLNKLIIDLGSGTGIAGLYAAALGAQVTLTDLPEVIPLLEKNIEANKTILKGSASARVLVWGEDCSQFFHPDFILVSDCIYHESYIHDLISTLIQLADSRTEVLISFEDRENKREILKSFLEALRNSFDVDYIPSKELHPEYQSPDIHLLKCKKKCANNKN